MGGSRFLVVRLVGERISSGSLRGACGCFWLQLQVGLWPMGAQASGDSVSGSDGQAEQGGHQEYGEDAAEQQPADDNAAQASI